MIRWDRSDPDRLNAQEMALLALYDRMTMLEQAVTIEIETRRKITLEQARLLSQQRDQLVEATKTIHRLEGRVERLDRDLRSLLAILEREE